MQSVMNVLCLQDAELTLQLGCPDVSWDDVDKLRREEPWIDPARVLGVAYVLANSASMQQNKLLGDSHGLST